MLHFLRFIKPASLFVLLISIASIKCADDNMVLPYTESISADTSTQQAPDLTQSAPAAIMNDANRDENADSPFADINLDPTSFRSAKTSHTNLIVALTQQEQRNNVGEIDGGDINSGIMRDVEAGVLSNIAQPFSAPDDPSKIAFIRLDVTRNAWIWNYFNDGTATQSVDQKNGTPQYLFFNKGNLISVLIGNRDDSAFASWVRSNTENQFEAVEQPAPVNPQPEAEALQAEMPQEEIIQPDASQADTAQLPETSAMDQAMSDTDTAIADASVADTNVAYTSDAETTQSNDPYALRETAQ